MKIHTGNIAIYKTTKTKVAGFCGTVILDSGANVSICNNKKDMSDLVETSQEIKGINGRKLLVRKRQVFSTQ